MNVESSKQKRSPEKEFKIRDSPLVTLFEKSQNAKTVYNVIIVSFITLLTYTVCNDYKKNAKSDFGLRFVVLGFQKLHLVLLVWCISNIITFSSYWCFILWASIGTTLKPKKRKSWDTLWFAILILYYFYFLYGLQIVQNVIHFTPGSATILFVEQARLLMKLHSFIRTNVPKVTFFKPHSDEILKLPKFKHFFYFLFAPTMIYRDEYPRTSQIRWKFVIFSFGELLGVIWFCSLLVETSIPPFEDICLRKFTHNEVLTLILTNAILGCCFPVTTFLTVMHSSQNAFAEMLQFGDRMFYKEWWSSKSMGEFYRTWNLLVHDWLYTYVYQEVKEILPKSKAVCRFAVFIVSAVVHEWIIVNVLGIFIPITSFLLLFEGVVLVLLHLFDFRYGNLVFVYLVGVVSSIEVSLIALELFAQHNCPLKENDTKVGFYIPRLITCGCIE